ncbi:hypothetical protein E4U60_002355 [Claviceps pazoutovae]|uniref:Uncharacterized protein n=1 Tax=Claviceps pazoutovae TaxID=1649127 RepID=A0A9P7MB80_9HYPO|nr:hypothetical protein E4U60_002355 [Claviceps pazoutovae]
MAPSVHQRGHRAKNADVDKEGRPDHTRPDHQAFVERSPPWLSFCPSVRILVRRLMTRASIRSRSSSNNTISPRTRRNRLSRRDSNSFSKSSNNFSNSNS